MELGGAAGAPTLVMVVVGNHDDEAAEVRAVDLHGNVIKRMQIGQPIIGRPSIHGDLLCASHGWGLTGVYNMVTGGDAVDAAAEPRKKVNSATPLCVLGHVPATGEYKVLRIQADYCSRRRRQMCEVMTLGGGGGGDGDTGRWRRRTPPPVTVMIEPVSSSGNVAVVAGLAYFLLRWSWENEQHLYGDSMAVFDMATEEWKPATLQGPLSSRILADMDEEDDDDDKLVTWRRYKPPPNMRVHLLCRDHFQLARLGESLVVVYCNVKKGFTELWFMEAMADDGTTARWSRRYTLQCTPFGDDRYSPVFHYPLALLDDKRILVWVDRTSALRAYDHETSAWTDLATLTGGSVVGTFDAPRKTSVLKSWGGSALILFQPLRWILRRLTMKMFPSE